MGRLLAGMTAAAVFVSSLPFQGMREVCMQRKRKQAVCHLKNPKSGASTSILAGRLPGLKTRLLPENTEAEWSNRTGTYIYYAGIGRSRLLDADANGFQQDRGTQFVCSQRRTSEPRYILHGSGS